LQAKKLICPPTAVLLPKAGHEEIYIGSQVLFTAYQFQMVFPAAEVVEKISFR
jgi:hypothetical protein